MWAHLSLRGWTLLPLVACPGSSWQSWSWSASKGSSCGPGAVVGLGPRVTCQRKEAGLSCCLCPLGTCMGFRDGPGFAFQNSKPDSLLKMEEEQKLEKSPLSGNIPGLISFRMDWLDLLAVEGTLKSLLQHHSSKASMLRHSAFFTVQLSHPYMTTGKTIGLTRQTFVGKAMSLLLNMLSRLVITFLPSSKRLLISCTDHVTQHALITWLITHVSRD